MIDRSLVVAGAARTPIRFAVSDIHGHLNEFLEALHEAGLVDSAARWSGGNQQLWCLGDYFDRGPDGVGVVDLLMRLSDEAQASGGEVQALLGNHEVLALGMHRFGATPILTALGERSFEASWARNQGQSSDQWQLSNNHIDWLVSRPAMALVAEHLLLHSDVVQYRQWGQTVAQVNQRVGQVLRSNEPSELWQLWSDLTRRYDFREDAGPAAANGMLQQFGGRRIMHGHSVIGESEGKEAAENTGAKHYADGLVTVIDAGLPAGGPCLLVEF